MPETQNLQTLLEEILEERADVDAVVDKQLRKYVCERFPDCSFEEIVASVHNQRQIAKLRIMLREEFLELFDREIAAINTATSYERMETRRTRKILKTRRLQAPLLRHPQQKNRSH